MKDAKQKKYQMFTIVRPTLSSDKATQLMQSMISLGPDEQLESQTMNMQVLAYPIDRNKQGHLVVSNINAYPDNAYNIRRKMEIDENILRVLQLENDTIQSDSEKEGASNTYAFQVGEEFIKMISSYITKMGKISFARVMPPKEKRAIALAIKRLRYLALLPFRKQDV